MKKYVKPMVLVNEELAEGVYAASGTTGASSIGVKLDVNTAWGYTVEYKLSLTNNTNEPTNEFTVKLQFSGNIEGVNYYGSGNASINGSVLTIDWYDQWNPIGVGETKQYTMQITGANSQLTYVKAL